MKIFAMICALMGGVNIECKASDVLVFQGSDNESTNKREFVSYYKPVGLCAEEKADQELHLALAIERFPRCPSIAKGTFQRLAKSLHPGIKRQALGYLKFYKDN